MIGLALAVAAFLGLWFRADFLAKKLDRVEAREAVALAANEAQAETINALRAAAERDSRLLRELDGLRAAIARAADERTAERERIAQDDPDVADFLSTPIPCGLRDNSDGDADCAGADPSQ